MADKVKVEIVTSADVSGADQAEKAIQRVERAAANASDPLKQLQDEIGSRLDNASKRIESLPAGDEAGAAGGGIADLAGSAAAATAAVAAYQALSAAVDYVRDRLAQGLEAAAGFNEQLRTLPADKADELRQSLGPLADLIDANSVALDEYAKRQADAKIEAEKFWAEIAVRAVPALNQLQDSLKGEGAGELAKRLGTDLAGASHLAAAGVNGLNYILSKVKTSTAEAGESFARYLLPNLSALEKWLNLAGRAWEAYDLKQQEALKGEKIAAATAETAKAIAEARTSALEAQLPLEDRIVSIRERQARLLDAANSGDEKARKEAAALEKQIVGLEGLVAKEKEVAEQKRATAAAAASDYELRLQLQEATNAGDQNTIDLLKQQIAYRAALKATLNEETAQRAAKIEADAQTKSRAEEAAKKEIEAAKGQRETDRKSQQAADAYEKQQELLKSKREELELETQINEAKALGNKEEVARLEWKKEYNELTAKGFSDEEATRAVNARAAANSAVLQAKREELELETQINEAKALGNEAEVARLEWKKQYNSLTAKGFTDDEARRAANAQSAASGAWRAPTEYVPPGQVAPGTNYRRGRTQSDASFAMAQADQNGGSLLDAYYANRGKPVGSIGGKDPTAAASAQQNPAAEAAKKLAEEVKKSNSETAKQIEQAVKSADNAAVIAAVNNLGNAIKQADKNLQQQIDALAQKI